jgi:GNAT superfamily N-acetyltransferase
MSQQRVSCIEVDYGNPAHTTLLLQLLQMYAQDPMGGGEAISADTTGRLIAEMAKRPHVFSILVFDTQSEKALGFANCIESFSTFKCRPVVNIHDFAVIPEARGAGVSQVLVEAIAQAAKHRDACKLTLEVLEGNKSAQRAYQKAGFKGYELDPEMGQALFWEKPL